MKSTSHELFICALNETRMIKLRFDSKDSGLIERRVIPLDYAVWKRTPNSSQLRYHFLDLDSAKGTHPLSILPEQISSMEILMENFNPADFINWVPAWHIARDWGVYS